MTMQKSLLAATFAALPLMLCQPALASGPAAPAAQESTSLISSLMAQRGRNGLGAEHGFALASAHPGVEGTRIARVNHTYKGVRVFGSESVLVTGTRPDHERVRGRPPLGAGARGRDRCGPASGHGQRHRDRARQRRRAQHEDRGAARRTGDLSGHEGSAPAFGG
ncbi:hypothetical protein LP420_11060 [Massilia sp. B-10]|nr:hypothetical protein LP420_11060 [Massilia sp. B-10]